MSGLAPEIADARTLRAFRRTAEAIVRETGRTVREALRGEIAHRVKPDDSFVTDLDLAVEDLVRDRLGQSFPDHAVLGEERGETRRGSPWRWIVDPIDGTHSLRHRVPLFGTLLALEHRGRPVVGVIDLPMLRRTYSAAAGLGAHRNGRALRLTDPPSGDALRHEIVAVGERKQFERRSRGALFDRLMREHASVRTYCDCFGHGLAVEGGVGAMVDYGLRTWDAAATRVLIEEAGGRFVRVVPAGEGEGPDDVFDVVFGKPAVVARLLETVRIEDPAARFVG